VFLFEETGGENSPTGYCIKIKERRRSIYRKFRTTQKEQNTGRTIGELEELGKKQE